jgi:hypothetical protein
MLAHPEDLVVRQPDSFASAEHRRIAAAFNQAWSCLCPLVAPQMAERTRLWLAELAMARGQHHTSIETLRLDLLVIALTELPTADLRQPDGASDAP